MVFVGGLVAESRGPCGAVKGAGVVVQRWGPTLTCVRGPVLQPGGGEFMQRYGPEAGGGLFIMLKARTSFIYTE